jgi:Flp pilus assembly protein TadG
MKGSLGEAGLFGSRRGHAVVEVVLLAPWIYFLFMGTLDMGFFTHAMISTQNAARAGAAYTSRNSATAGDSAAACRYALAELKAMSNVRTLSNCNSSPLVVTATAITGVDGSPASSVSVNYLTDRLIPIPGLARQFTITRIVEMPVK